MTKVVFTKSIRKITFWNFTGMIILYIIFNLFAFNSLNYVLVENLKSRLVHELKHIVKHSSDSTHGLGLNNDELEEDDLVNVTEHPFFLQVYDKNKEIIIQSENVAKFAPIPTHKIHFDSEYRFEQIKAGGRVLVAAYSMIKTAKGKTYYFQLSTFKSIYNYITKNILLFNLFTFPVVLVLVGLFSFYLAKKSYQPITEIISTAKEISANNLSKRIEYEAESSDELGMLRDTLNNLLSRLENQMNKISNFTDNASHQLMTPLTAIKTELEYALKKDRTIDEYKEALHILGIESERMIRIVNTLLVLAKECEGCADHRMVFNLNSILQNDIKNIYPFDRLKIEIEKKIFLRGKSDYFLLALQNLIENALKYSKDDVIISCYRAVDKVYISVEDRGIGIPDNQKSQIFERFYRGNVNNIEGFGLGLSLTHSIIKSMDGEIKVEDNQPRGTRFIIILPIVRFE